jgi:hypothetical protein
MNVDVVSAIANNVAQYLSPKLALCLHVQRWRDHVWRWESLKRGGVACADKRRGGDQQGYGDDLRPDYDRTTATARRSLTSNSAIWWSPSGPPVTSKVIYDGFAASSGSLKRRQRGTGWSGNWSLGVDPYATYVSGSFSSGYSTISIRRNKAFSIAMSMAGGFGHARLRPHVYDRRVFFAFIMNMRRAAPTGTPDSS